MFTFFSTELRIDEEDFGQRQSDSSSEQYSPSLLLGKDTFEGCITNLYLRRSLFVTFIKPIISALESLPTCLNFHIKYIYIISGFISVKMYYVSALTCLCLCVFADLILFIEQRTWVLTLPQETCCLAHAVPHKICRSSKPRRSF